MSKGVSVVCGGKRVKRLDLIEAGWWHAPVHAELCRGWEIELCLPRLGIHVGVRLCQFSVSNCSCFPPSSSSCVFYSFFFVVGLGAALCVCVLADDCAGSGSKWRPPHLENGRVWKKCGCLGSLIVIISVTTGSQAALVWRRQPQRGTEASSRLQSYFRWILMTWLSTRRANWAQDLKAVEIWCIICDGATGFHFDHRWMSTGGPGCGRRLRRGRQPTPVNAIDFSKCAVTNQLMKATRRLEWLWAQSAAAPLGPFFFSLSLSLFHCLYHQRNWSRNMLKTAGRSCRISLMTGRAGVRAENESSVKHCWKCCTDRPCLGFSAVSVIAVWCGCL